MELKQFIILIWRWFWLLILGLALGAAAGVLYSRYQTPEYQTNTKVLVMRAPDSSASGLAYMGDQQLSSTFVDLITTRPIFDAATSQLGFEVESDQIEIEQDTNSQIISIMAEDSDPQRCALIANTVADVAIKRYVDLQVGQYAAIENDVRTHLSLIQNRMAELQSQITSTSETIMYNQEEEILSKMEPLQDEVSLLRQDIARLTPAATPEEKALLAERQARLDQILPLLDEYQTAFANLVVLKKPMGTGSYDENNLILLQDQLAAYGKNYVDLTSKLELLQQNYVKGISNVIRIQDASVPASPARPNVLMNTLLASVAGFVLALIIILVLENLGVSLGSPKKKREQLEGVREEKV